MPKSYYSKMQDDGHIVDRQNIKWTAMMLTEHRELLRDMMEAQNDVDPPEHDQDRLAEIAESLSRAMMEGKIITLSYWKDKRNHQLVGVIKRIDPQMKAVLIEHDNDKTWIQAQHIVNVDYSYE